MKKYLFITMCAFLSLWTGEVPAQRYLPGQTGLQLTLGGVDDFGRNVRHLRGNFQAGLALSRYNRNRSRWVFGVDYVKKHYAYKETAVPKEQFTRWGMSIREVENQVRKWNLLLSARRDLPAGSECR